MGDHAAVQPSHASCPAGMKKNMKNTAIEAEFRLPTNDVQGDIPFYMKELGMRLDTIFPADDPAVAVLSGHGLRLRLERGAPEHPGTIRLLTENPDEFADGERELIAPNGTRVEIDYINPPLIIPETEHAFVVRRLKDKAPWIIGRAGMRYRDLIPSRLGGSIIASHIRIPDGGPVPDVVHYHTVGFQLIFCYRGWVDIVYEDQGDPLRLHGGDCLIQPPEIRHCVLYASEDIEVIEIGVPAQHVTTIDHDMTLPNGLFPGKEYQGQEFVHHVKARASWRPFRLPGFRCRDTGINLGTRGVAGVQVVRSSGGDTAWSSNDADIHFSFVMEGNFVLEGEGEEPRKLSAGDAFVLPPGMNTRYSGCSGDLELLEVTLPGEFKTEILE